MKCDMSETEATRAALRLIAKNGNDVLPAAVLKLLAVRRDGGVDDVENWSAVLRVLIEIHDFMGRG
jgi:hypothetical protein